MTSLIHHNQQQQQQQPANKRLYYVIGRCDSLKAPAIFLDWDDCSFYVDQNENDCQVEMQSFDRIMDAVNYLTDQLLTQRNSTTLNPSRYTHTHTLAAASATATAAGNQPPPHDDDGSASAVGNNNNNNSRAGMTLPTRAKRPRTEPATSENNNTPLASSPCAKQPRTEPATVVVPTTPAAGNAHAHENANSNSASKKSPFEKKCAMLREYQQFHGTLDVKTKHCQDQFKGLNDFIFYWKKKRRLFHEDQRDHPSLKSAMVEAQLQQLQDLGVDFSWNKRRWEGKCQQLQEYKERHGKMSVSHGHPLRSWCCSQRNHMRKYEQDPETSNLKEEQYQRLVDLGLKRTTDGTKTPTTTTTTGGGTKIAATPAVPATPAARITTTSSWEEMLENTS